MHRRALVLASLSLIAAPPLSALTVMPSQPRDIVARIYELAAGANGKYEGASVIDNKEVRSRYLSKSLDQAILKAYAKSKRLNEPVIDFDPILNTQEQPEVKGLEFVVETATPDKATVAAKFTSYGVRTVIRYDFVRENNEWRIFELRGDTNGKDPWSLRKIAGG